MIHRKAEGEWKEKEEIDVISTEEVDEDEERMTCLVEVWTSTRCRKGRAEEVEHMRPQKNLEIIDRGIVRRRHGETRLGGNDQGEPSRPCASDCASSLPPRLRGVLKRSLVQSAASRGGESWREGICNFLNRLTSLLQ